MNLKTFSKGVVHPEEYNLTGTVPTVQSSLPKIAVFPLSHLIGAPVVAVV